MRHEKKPPTGWIDYLSEEDRAFVKRFVLASGSLKEMAKVYNISYPTVRLRLDRLIAKIKVVDDQQITSAFERLLRAQFADGKIDPDTFKLLLTAHRQELEDRHADLEDPDRGEPDSRGHFDGAG
jgi:hypothetical protein